MRPDGDIESKTIAWCLDNDFFEVEPGLWSGPWYDAARHAGTSSSANGEEDREGQGVMFGSGRDGKGRAKGTQAFGKGRGSTRGKGFAKGKEGPQRPFQLFSFGREHPDELYAQAKAAKQPGMLSFIDLLGVLIRDTIDVSMLQGMISRKRSLMPHP